MSEEYEEHRVKYYSETDFSASFHLERIEELLSSAPTADDLSVNDAIKLYQCSLILTHYLSEEVKQTDPYQTLIANAKTGRGIACKVVKDHLFKYGIKATYEEVCLNYKDALIGFIADNNLFSDIAKDDIMTLLDGSPSCMSFFFEHDKLVERYHVQLRNALVNNPVLAAQIIIQAKAVKPIRQSSIKLPKSLTQEDLNSIFKSYIESDHPNNNYLDAIVRWRDDWWHGLFPEVKSAAEKRIAQVNESLFDNPHAGLHYGTEIQFCENQKECVILDVQGYVSIHKYGTKWIQTYSDYATLLNNLIFIFGLADYNGLLSGAKPDNSHSTILDAITLNVRDGYKTSIGFNMEDMRTQGIIAGYYDTLKRIGIELESVIEWYFNEYVESEYGITGFRVDMPHEGTYYAKCKDAFSEVERVLKAYSLLIRLGEIDKGAFKHEKFRGFRSLRSRIENKYVVPNGEEYEIATWSLFSNQCMLSYNPNTKDSHSCFFNRLTEGPVNRSDCPEFENERLD